MQPALIEMARVAAGLTQGQLAKALGKSQPFISQVEHGEKEIPASLVDAWCEACDVTPALLRRGDMPLDESASAMVHRRLRSLPAKQQHRADAQLKLHAVALDSLFDEIDLVPFLETPRVPPGTGPEDAAMLVRRVWRVPSGPVPSLVTLVESAGLPVLPMDSMPDKQSGMSHKGRVCDWLIAVNSQHPASRQRFTLAHEFGHIVLNHDAELTVDRSRQAELEQQANVFASAFLMPPDDARRELRTVTFKRLVLLKQRWRVSVAFLIRRALDVGAISPEERKRLEIQLSTQPGGRRREPAEFEPETPDLIKRMIDALQQAGMSIPHIAALMRITERRLRTVFLREPDRHLQVVGDSDRQRVVVELPRPN